MCVGSHSTDAVAALLKTAMNNNSLIREAADAGKRIDPKLPPKQV